MLFLGKKCGIFDAERSGDAVIGRKSWYIDAVMYGDVVITLKFTSEY